MVLVFAVLRKVPHEGADVSGRIPMVTTRIRRRVQLQLARSVPHNCTTSTNLGRLLARVVDALKCCCYEGERLQ